MNCSLFGLGSVCPYPQQTSTVCVAIFAVMEMEIRLFRMLWFRSEIICVCENRKNIATTFSR